VRAGALAALAFGAAATLSGCTLIQTLSEASEIPEPDAWMTESPSATSTPAATTSAPAPTPSATTSPSSLPSNITYVADPREIEGQIVTTIKSELNVDVTAKCPDTRIDIVEGAIVYCDATRVDTGQVLPLKITLQNVTSNGGYFVFIDAA